MTAEEIHAQVAAQFKEDIVEFNGEALDPYIKINPSPIFEISQFLKTTPNLNFDALMCLSGLDYGADKEDDSLGLVYNLHSIKHNHKITIRVDLNRKNAKLPSVEKIWRTADWHEREAYDLFGVIFENHPDLRRILCPDDWQGYPLRKDYVTQKYYHGVRVDYQEDWGQYKTLEDNPERGNYVFQFEEKAPGLTSQDKKTAAEKGES